MENGERKSSEDLIREAQERLRSFQPRPDAEVTGVEVEADAPPALASQSTP